MSWPPSTRPSKGLFELFTRHDPEAAMAALNALQPPFEHNPINHNPINHDQINQDRVVGSQLDISMQRLTLNPLVPPVAPIKKLRIQRRDLDAFISYILIKRRPEFGSSADVVEFLPWLCTEMGATLEDKLTVDKLKRQKRGLFERFARKLQGELDKKTLAVEQQRQQVIEAQEKIQTESNAEALTVLQELKQKLEEELEKLEKSKVEWVVGMQHIFTMRCLNRARLADAVTGFADQWIASTDGETANGEAGQTV